jgi:hypothetical protein
MHVAVCSVISNVHTRFVVQKIASTVYSSIDLSAAAVCEHTVMTILLWQRIRMQQTN